MLKLTLKPGEYIDIGDDIRVVFSGGSANNIHLMIDAPRELNIARSSAGGKSGDYYYKDEISTEAQREIVNILKREKAVKRQEHEGTDYYNKKPKKIYKVEHKNQA